MRPASRAITRRLNVVALSACLGMLAACGGGDNTDKSLASLDQRLAGNATSGANGNAMMPASNDAAPPYASALHRGGTENAVPNNHGNAVRTLGALARSQRNAAAQRAIASGEVTDRCGRQISYGDGWAEQMPAPFRLYPGARLSEAAGVTTSRCALRVISFSTLDAPSDVIAHYSRTARDAGYDAEESQSVGQLCLGGTRGDDAYIIFVRRAGAGGTEVDIVATAT